MLTLKDVLSVCDPDWIETTETIINVALEEIPDQLFQLPIKKSTAGTMG